MERPARRHRQASDAAAANPVSLVGFMGSGKSVVGALVAHRSQARFVDLDLMIESEAGMSVAEIFSSQGEASFRALESRLLPAALQGHAVVALGGGTSMDDANWKLIQDRSTSVYLELPFESIWQRIRMAENRPLVAGRARADVMALFEGRRTRYEQAAHRVDADRSPDEVAADVLELWCG